MKSINHDILSGWFLSVIECMVLGQKELYRVNVWLYNISEKNFLFVKKVHLCHKLRKNGVFSVRHNMCFLLEV